MHYQFHPYLIALIVSGGISLTLAIFSLRRLSIRGAKELVACYIIATIWIAANALEMAGTDLPTKLFWANLQYFGYGFTPIAWLALTFRFSGLGSYLTPRFFALIGAIPAITFVLVWLDLALGLVRNSFSLDLSGDFPVIAKRYGPWFYPHYIYCYLVNILGIVILILNLRRKDAVFHRQTASILIGLGIAFAANLVYVLGIGPVKRYDLSHVVFGISSLILWMGIFRFRIFKLVPIARRTVFEQMMNGILVLDDEGSIIDCNDSARAMLGLGSPIFASKHAYLLPGDLARSIESAKTISSGRDWYLKEMLFDGPSGKRYFELHASRLRDERFADAWVVVLEDVTELRLARDKIVRQREELAAAAEHEKLSQELHDNLGQVLSFAVMQSDAVLYEMENGDETLAMSQLRRLRDIVKGAHEDLRSLVRGIRDAEYETLSFGSILAKEAESFRQCYDAEVLVRLSAGDSSIPFSAARKKHLARILKETLNNVAKHAKASRVEIAFSREGDRCRLTVDDDGVGPPASAQALMEGSGLCIMAERARCLGGSLSVEPREGGGTRVSLSFPETERADENTDS